MRDFELETLELLSKYWDVNEDKLALQVLYADANGNLETMFIIYYSFAKWPLLQSNADYEGEKIGEILTKVDREVVKARKVILLAYSYSISEGLIKIHYNDSSLYKRTFNFHGWKALEKIKSEFLKTKIIRGVQVFNEDIDVNEITQLLKNELDSYPLEENIPKIGNKRNTLNKTFLQSLFPYYRYLIAEEILDPSQAYERIAQNVNLSESDKLNLKPYFSEGEAPLEKVDMNSLPLPIKGLFIEIAKKM